MKNDEGRRGRRAARVGRSTHFLAALNFFGFISNVLTRILPCFPLSLFATGRDKCGGIPHRHLAARDLFCVESDLFPNKASDFPGERRVTTIEGHWFSRGKRDSEEGFFARDRDNSGVLALASKMQPVFYGILIFSFKLGSIWGLGIEAGFRVFGGRLDRLGNSVKRFLVNVCRKFHVVGVGIRFLVFGLGYEWELVSWRQSLIPRALGGAERGNERTPSRRSVNGTYGERTGRLQRAYEG
jgi:hypothetical protein